MSVGDVAFSVQSLLGQNGGVIAIAYGAGAASGWAFAISTAYRSMKAQLTEQRESHKRAQDDCDRRIAELERWVREQNERYVGGLERQAEQARQSAARMTGIVTPRSRRTKPLDPEG